MTQFFPFVPNPIVAPRFSPILDGQACSVVVTWNEAGQRYYINVYGVDGTFIVSVPIVTTPHGILLASLIYNPFRKVMIGKLQKMQCISPGTVVQFTLQDCLPDIYNQKFNCTILDDDLFEFDVASNLGEVITPGSVHQYINMIDPWFKISSMIFRDSVFEVRP